MEHFYENVDGWFSPEGAYTEFFNHFTEEPDVIVEVGVWKGKSASFLGVELLNRNWKTVKFNLVDTFEGSPEHKGLDKRNLLEITTENLSPLNELSMNIIKNRSVECSKEFDNDSIDFVFLDARHEYKDVLDDIKSWLPKVKSGGVISGDDHNATWPGVEKAVKEVFGDNYKKIMIQNREGVYHWWYQKK